jgi:hypothetical protein
MAGGLTGSRMSRAVNVRGGRAGVASLREDYLNQVQRDFLSRSLGKLQHP